VHGNAKRLNESQVECNICADTERIDNAICVKAAGQYRPAADFWAELK